MAEVEYGGIKVGGSKLLLIIPLIGTLGGGLWAGFEFYKDYMDMKEQIQEYVAPDLSEFDKQAAMRQQNIGALAAQTGNLGGGREGVLQSEYQTIYLEKALMENLTI